MLGDDRERLTYEQMARGLAHVMAQVDWQEVPLTPEARRSADQTDLPWMTHKGVLEIPGLGSLRCYQLSDGSRVFDAEDVHRLFGLPPQMN